MSVLWATRPASLHFRRVRLPAGPAAAATARAHVRAAMHSWDTPVSRDTAALLVSELVTNAVRQAPCEAVVLAIRASAGQLRVEVHDKAPGTPAVADVPVLAESGRGLMLVSALASEWGWHRVPGGKAVYFTLKFRR